MRKSLVPAFDAATREMFSQISVSLDKGIASQSSDDKIEKLVEAMALHMSTMAKSIDSLSTEISQLRSEIKSNGPATTTGQDASAPVVDAKEVVRKEILNLLEKKNYEAGFTKALSASTIEMAVYLWVIINWHVHLSVSLRESCTVSKSVISILVMLNLCCNFCKITNVLQCTQNVR
jgi:enhancer of mRNA-decapping protein 4